MVGKYSTGKLVLLSPSSAAPRWHRLTCCWLGSPRAGASWDQILRALTDAPATLWDDQDSGRVEPGMRADLILLGTDPRADISAFAAVDLVMKDGMVIQGR